MRQALSRLSENYEGPYSFFLPDIWPWFSRPNERKRGLLLRVHLRTERSEVRGYKNPDPPILLSLFSHASKDFLFPIIPRIPFWGLHFSSLFFARKRFKMSPTAKAKEELWMNLNALKKIFLAFRSRGLGSSPWPWKKLEVLMMPSSLFFKSQAKAHTLSAQLWE